MQNAGQLERPGHQPVGLDAGHGLPPELVGAEQLSAYPGDEQATSIRTRILEGSQTSQHQHNKDLVPRANFEQMFK